MGRDQESEAQGTPEPPPEVAPSESQKQGRPPRSLLSSLFSTLKTLRSLFVDLAIVGAAVGAVAFFVLILFDDTVVIEAPSVPKAVLDRGLTPELLTELLQARVNEIRDSAQSSKSPETASPALEAISINTAGLNVSLNSLAHMAQRLFGLGSRKAIRMSVVCPTADCSDDVLVLHVVTLTEDAVLDTATPLDMGDLDAAMDVVSTHLLLSFDPHLLAIYRLRQEDFEFAGDIARRMILERHPQAIWAYNLLGIIKSKSGDLDVAQKYFERALEMKNNFVPAMVNLGNLYVLRNERDSAMAQYESALAADPANVFANVGLGRILLRNCNWVEATRVYERAFEADPGISSVLDGLAQVKRHQGDTAAARSLEQLVAASKAQNGKASVRFDALLESAMQCGAGGSKIGR